MISFSSSSTECDSLEGEEEEEGRPLDTEAALEGLLGQQKGAAALKRGAKTGSLGEGEEELENEPLQTGMHYGGPRVTESGGNLLYEWRLTLSLALLVLKVLSWVEKQMAGDHKGSF